METVVVTGGSGYFGSVLVRHLVARKARVRVFDLVDDPARPEGVEFFPGDIRDRAAVRAACQGADAVFHSVALVPLAKDKPAFWSVNRDGTEVLLSACLEFKVGKVVHLSSSAVFGAPKRNPVREDDPPVPQEDYGRAKLAAEEVCKAFVAKGLDVTVARPRTIIGPGRLGIMQIIFEWVKRGRNLPVLGGGDNLYQFIHADDLAEACLAAAQRLGPAVYNLGAKDFGSMRQTLQGLIDHAGSRSRIVSLPFGPTVAVMRLSSALGLSPLGPYHSLMYGRSMFFDLGRAEADLGFAPRHGNVAMFREAYDWYLAHREAVLAGQGLSIHRRAARQGLLAVASLVLELARVLPK